MTGLVYKSTVRKLSLSDRTGLFYWLMLSFLSRCLFYSPMTAGSEVTRPTDEQLSAVIQKDLVMNVFRDGELGSFRHIPLLSGWSTAFSSICLNHTLRIMAHMYACIRYAVKKCAFIHLSVNLVRLSVTCRSFIERLNPGFYPEIFSRGCETDSRVSHGRDLKGRQRGWGLLLEVWGSAVSSPSEKFWGFAYLGLTKWQMMHCHVYSPTNSVSQKKSPLRFSEIFSQTDGKFLKKFYTPIIRSFLY